MIELKILLACEESQTVCAAFRAKGHEAYSCDIQSCSGNHPEWHIKDDVLLLLKSHYFFTQDFQLHHVYEWDLIIAFPPCTFLSNAGIWCFNVDKLGEKAIQRHKDRCKAAHFFMQFVNAPCKRIAIENPVGIMSKWYRQPDQIIHHYYFTTPEDTENFVKKRTCLWLKNLPVLQYDQPEKEPGANWCESRPHTKDRQKIRSKTFPVIAEAMAEQWGNLKEGDTQ